MESAGGIHTCLPAASGGLMILPSGKTVMGDGESTNMRSRTTSYPAVGTAKKSCTSIVLKEKNTACKLFLNPCWHCWFLGVLCFIRFATRLADILVVRTFRGSLTMLSKPTFWKGEAVSRSRTASRILNPNTSSLV
jgi:hypothetical protein